MNIRRFTTFAFVLMIASLIMGFSACDQIGQLLIPATPQTEGTQRGDSHRRCLADYRAARRDWLTDGRRF